MFEQYYDKIADLLFFGINLKPGDKIWLAIDADQRDFAKVFIPKAYEKGAAYVELKYADDFKAAGAIAGSQPEYFVPDYVKKTFEEISQVGWKSVGVYSNLESDVYEGLDTARSTRYFKQMAEVSKVRKLAIMSNKFPWTLTYLPSVPMAKKAFPELSDQEALKRYQDAVVRILHLDQQDPVAIWKDKLVEHKRLSSFMNDLAADFLHFKGPGTDLKVYLNKKARWIGGMDKSTQGEEFVANIPTDEIFTTPQWSRTEGRVALTKPFVMHQNLGPMIQDAWFEFKDGRVVDYGARTGKETLDAFFDMDEGGRYLGEVALVDPQAAIAKEGITFYNGLYDENAACHIALGRAYGFTMKEPKDLSDEDFKALGFNTANVHEDMMIGGEEVDVTAVTSDGKRVDVIKDGKLVI